MEKLKTDNRNTSLRINPDGSITIVADQIILESDKCDHQS